MNKLGIVIALGLAACGGGQKTGTTTSEVTCDQAAAHIAELMTHAEDGDDLGPRSVPVVTQHCTDDGWTADARACVSNVADPEASKACLTGEQAAAIDAAMEALDSDGGGDEDTVGSGDVPASEQPDQFDDSEDQ